MPQFGRSTFLQKGTKLSTTCDDECPICYEAIPEASTRCSHTTRLQNTKHATMTLVFRPGIGNGLLMPRIKPSLYNCMLRIKLCGHCFCYDCLEEWVAKHNTCPLCRVVLFFKKYVDENRDSQLSSREYLDIGDMGEPAARSMHGHSGNPGNYNLHQHGWENALLPAVVQERGGDGVAGPSGGTVDLLEGFDLPLWPWGSDGESAVDREPATEGDENLSERERELMAEALSIQYG